MILDGIALVPALADEPQWHGQHVIGQFLNSNPPKPDQVFNFQYRVLNGTLVELTKNQYGQFEATVQSTDQGMLELKIPRNYPYTNMGYPFYNNTANVAGTDAVIDVNGVIIDSKKYSFAATDCFFEYSIPFSGQPIITLGFIVYPEHIAFQGDSVPDHCIGETTFIDSPLKQFKSGIAAKDVACKTEFVLVIKSEDDSPACLKPDTATKLITRGWSKVILTTENTNLNTISENGCGQFYTIPENKSNFNTIPVLILKQNSTGCAKLTYAVNSLFNNTNDCVGCHSQMVKTVEMLRIGKYNYATNGNSYGISSSIDATPMFKIESIPDVIDISKYPVGSNFTVVFIIKPLLNATGFYDYSIEKPPCNDYPLAVGYSQDQVNSSDFSKGLSLMQNHSCVSGLYGISAVQVSGMDYTQIKLN